VIGPISREVFTTGRSTSFPGRHLPSWASVGALLTGVSIACIVAGSVLLAVQLRQRPAQSVAPRPAGSPPPAPSARSGASRRRRVLFALLLAMASTLAAAVVVQERLVWGIHLLVDDVFLGYLAWLARRAEIRDRAASQASSEAPAPAPPPEPAVDVTDARA
jgi:hypothetical protein